MTSENAAPCRHVAAPLESNIEKVIDIVQSIALNNTLLASYGLSADEYSSALPSAIQRMRGSASAKGGQKRKFLGSLLQELVSYGLAESVSSPKYGADTVYRISIVGLGDVAIIQKGCPDGQHSSVRWAAPDWAIETYLWWQCSSLNYAPGEHVHRGINRLRQRFFSETPGAVDGVIFHNELCGTGDRPCPKMDRAIEIDGTLVPPPCVYIMPRRNNLSSGSEWNWRGDENREFPRILMSMFGIPNAGSSSYVGYVGFQRRGNTVRSTIMTGFGHGRSTKFRS